MQHGSGNQVPPLVTVLMATYNQAQYLSAALDSLRAQTLAPGRFEVIVINDGSTDGTAQALEHYQDWARVIQRPNRGLIASCNEGLHLAKGRYFARLDSDDLVLPEWLECLVDPLERDPAVSCAHSDRYELQDSERIYVKTDVGNLYQLVACGTVFRTDMLRAIGGYRAFYWEEYDLYLRLRREGGFLRVPRPLYTYRKHALSMTQSPERRLEGWAELAREWGESTLRTAGTNAEMEQALLALEMRS